MNALALIVGNIDYALTKNKLVNAVNDANDFGHKLLNLGFTVNILNNTTVEILDREVSKFGNDLKDYDVGLFYFSGHGFQIQGKNYLTSINTNFTDGVSVKHSSLPLDEVVDYMNQANTNINIMILDACRDNPFPDTQRSVSELGLASVFAPKGTLIAYSTSPGETALDYGSGRNSIYTGSLLNHIDDPNIPIEEFFKRVRTSVFFMSKGKQTSWEHTSLIGDFFFNSGQLVHSVDLPYREECIADSKFKSSGSEIDKIIEGLRSHDWYEQAPALGKFSNLDYHNIDESSLFLIGRNILQSAIGGEYSAMALMEERLASWLSSRSTGKENHILNGMLFEIYFNNEGKFRQYNFKDKYLEELFSLQKNHNFNKSFEFIAKQLEHFKPYLFYTPADYEKSLPIELQFTLEETGEGVLKRKAHILTSIKHQNVELLAPDDDEFGGISTRFDQLKQRLGNMFCTPEKKIKISMNVQEKELGLIYIPTDLKLNRVNQDN
tara:strand:+ start:5909 stop:7390 length:1482 start_codon:yes stop_codon:yes gene_type:complete